MIILIKTALRIIAVAFWISILGATIPYIGYAINSLNNPDNFLIWSYILNIVVGVIVSYLVWLFLWRRAEKTTKLLAGDFIDEHVTININGPELLSLATRFLGIYLVVTTIPAIIGRFAAQQYYFQTNNSWDIDMTTAQNIQFYINNGLLLLVGIFLIAGGIRKSLEKMRQALDIPKRTDSDD
jgi:hypothetical protein